MKSVFSKSIAGSSVALGKAEEKSKETFRFNFFGPDEAELAALLKPDNEPAKKKKKKKKSKKKGSSVEQSADKDESGSDDDEAAVQTSSATVDKLESKTSQLSLAEEAPPANDKSSTKVDSVAIASTPEASKSSNSKKKNKNKKKTQQEPITTNTTTSPAPTPTTDKKPATNSSKKSGKKAASAPAKGEDEDLDAIIAHYISSDPPAPKHKPAPRTTPKSFTSPDKKVRIFSPHDPELDPKLRVQAKYGKGKNLVAIGPPKRRDPRWLDAPPGFEHLAPGPTPAATATAAGPAPAAAVSGVMKGQKAEADATGASPFSFGFSLF